MFHALTYACSQTTPTQDTAVWKTHFVASNFLTQVAKTKMLPKRSKVSSK